MHQWYENTKRWLERFSWYIPVRITPFRRPSNYLHIYDPETHTVAITAPREIVRRMLHKGEVVLRNGRFYLVFPEIDEEELEERLENIDRIVNEEEV